MKTMRDFLVWYNNRDVIHFLQAIDKQFAFYQQHNIDMFKDGISVPALTLLYLFRDLPSKTYLTVFNKTNSDLHHLVRNNIVGGPAIIFHRYHEKDITKIRGEETCRSIEGYDANALYLWALMKDMPTGWYMRRREENEFRPQQAQPYGHMVMQWLTWESVRTGYSIGHQVNGREKQIGKLPVDGWCVKTHTAYQFHGCFFHGCPMCYDENEMNSVNGKTMAELLANTKTHTAYLRRFVDVVELWECEWKGKRIESDTKRFIDAEFPRRSSRRMTQQQILAGVVDGTLFGMVECDVCVPEELQDHFFRNAALTYDPTHMVQIWRGFPQKFVSFQHGAAPRCHLDPYLALFAATSPTPRTNSHSSPPTFFKKNSSKSLSFYMVDLEVIEMPFFYYY